MFCLPSAGSNLQFFHPIFTQPGKCLLVQPCSLEPPSSPSFILAVHAPFLTNPQSQLPSSPFDCHSGFLPRLLSGRGHLPRYTNFHILTSPPHAAAAHSSFSGFLEVQKMNGTAGAGSRARKAYQCVPRFYSKTSAGTFAR